MSKIKTNIHFMGFFFPKILEKPMYNRLICSVNKHNILPEAQIGFRKMKSTKATSQTLIQSIQEATDKCLYK